MKKLLLLYVICVTLSFSAINEYKTDVYFANGIFTEKRDAIINGGILEDAIVEKYGYNEFERRIGEVGYSYNQTEGFWDVIESLFQKFDWDGALDYMFEKHHADVEQHVIKYKNRILAGHKVLVVAHSQGNLFALDTYEKLGEESNVSTLNVGEKAELTVFATYSDGSTSELDANIEYIITPSDSLDVNGSVLTAKKDGDVSVQAKVGTTLSNTLNLNITWVVNGHVLPPEPDPTINNSTLLGIDVNDNGVRDDVERIIYKTYQNKHPIHIDIGMQAARGYKLVLESPERARAIRGVVNGALFCASYYEFEAQFFNDPILVHERIDAPVKSKYFNTKERNNIYWQYDTLLSGGVYPLPKDDEMKSFCDFNTSSYDKE